MKICDLNGIYGIIVFLLESKYAVKLYSTTKHTVISSKWRKLCAHINKNKSENMLCTYKYIYENGMYVSMRVRKETHT